MARPPAGAGLLPAPGQDEVSTSTTTQHLWDDPLLRIAFLMALLLLAYQLAVTLLQPAWIGPVTDWLLALVVWAGLVVVVLVSRYFTQTGRLAANSWWWVSAALFSFAIARTLWLVENQFLFPSHVPFPSLADLFFVLQYPCYLLALILVPRARPVLQRTLMVLDGCLLLGAAFALSWYFLLAPIYQNSQETLLGTLMNLSYPVGDLAIFFGLTVIWLHYREYALERVVLGLLSVATACLVVADSWFALLLLHAPSYRSGSPPDLFWMAFALLLPLAGLVRFRLMQRTLAGASAGPVGQTPNLRQQDLIAGLRVTFPVAAAWLVGTVLIIRGELVASVLHPVAPPLIAVGLMGLALLRLGLTAVENERLRREREEALRQTTARMETFLGIAGHELKNPLASMLLCLQLAERRIRRMPRREQEDATDIGPLLEPIVQAQRQEKRLDRLVNDLVDDARVQAGTLELHLKQADLAAIVHDVVEEQRQVSPERTLLWECPGDLRVPALVDAHRLGQVVTNYLTNALKYSPADRPVEVGLQVDERQARIWVRDEGPGLPPEEQKHIWERFHRAKGIEDQSGTGIGLGLGLHICRVLIELHQGQVGVLSAPGQGSTFWFTVPKVMPGQVQGAGAEEGTPGGLTS